MCLAKAYINDNKGEPLLKDISAVETGEGKVLMRTLFGERKEVAANIKEIDFLKSSIILESVN